MKTFTVSIYGLFGALALIAGVAAVVSPGLVVPHQASSAITTHLVREEGAAFVFIGLMFFWCARRFDDRRPVHVSLLVFALLFAGIHWADYLAGHGAITAVVGTTTAALLLAVTVGGSDVSMTRIRRDFSAVHQ